MTTNNDEDADERRTDTDCTVDTTFLEFLVCPITKASLTYSRERNELISRGARLAYPIVDGIPLMAPDAARELDDDESY